MKTDINVTGFYTHICTHPRELHTQHSISQKLDSSALLGKTYPIGSIYMSVSATSPASLFGGTWERIQDRFLLAAGSSYGAGRTGGAATVSLSASQIPAHSHWMGLYTDSSGSSTIPAWTMYLRDRWATNSNWASTNGSSKANCTSGATGFGNTDGGSGTGAAHNNMPPYLSVYVWKRTA